MELTRLINHPEEMDKETLYDLRSLLALHPYYQTARLLMLQNLYVLHDSSFDEELRRAAIYITDRKVIFKMIEAAHYQLRQESKPAKQVAPEEKESRTVALIDTFLDSIPSENDEEKKHKRKPTPADAAVDYVSYLMEMDTELAMDEEDEDTEEASTVIESQKADRTTSLIDNFLEDGGFKLHMDDELPQPEPLQEYSLTNNSDSKPQADKVTSSATTLQDEEKTSQEEGNEGYFTETLARIYIKQGRYEKALEIIQRLNLNYPKKNAYFADQMRFLEKLIINNKNKK